ncbi:MAG: PilT/PilU family type 4a pilus ATPase [Patescibacteria group bacterium]|nr:PilT/PilU family type 4a pilus ATPase [Patescibacteria group bacterium]
MEPNVQAEQRMKNLLETVVQQGASDLHINSGHSPVLRIDGRLAPLASEQPLNQEQAAALISSVMNENQLKKLESDRNVDFSFMIEEKARFRANVFYQQNKITGAYRLINSKIPTIEELNLPPVIHEFAKLSQGLVLFVGPTGHGKSTSMASLIDEINHNRTEHILTIEDPIEYVYEEDQCLINQREVNQDVLSFHDGLRASFREDVDVILLGEMRDLETISAAITAAETGHLIFSTLHTNDSWQTIDRIIDVFPSNQQNQIRSQLASVLAGIVSQRLLPRIGGGRIPATEVLIRNDAVENLIREGQIQQIINVLETGTDVGMQSINRSLANLVKEEKITLEDAEKYATDRDMFHMLIK